MTPYTHADHAAYCQHQAQFGRVPSRRPVQVMRRGVPYCAQLVEPWTTPSGIDCWTVESIYPEQLRMTVPVKMVRACGDACTCGGAA